MFLLWLSVPDVLLFLLPQKTSGPTAVDTPTVGDEMEGLSSLLGVTSINSETQATQPRRRQGRYGVTIPARPLGPVQSASFKPSRSAASPAARSVRVRT